MRKTLSKRLPGEHFSCPPDLFSWCGDYMIAVVDEDFTLLSKEPKNTLKPIIVDELQTAPELGMRQAVLWA